MYYALSWAWWSSAVHNAVVVVEVVEMNSMISLYHFVPRGYVRSRFDEGDGSVRTVLSDRQVKWSVAILTQPDE